LGNDRTRHRVRSILETLHATAGDDFKVVGGGLNDAGVQRKELYFRQNKEGGALGASYLDGALQHQGTGRHLLFNDYSAKADGFSPTGREEAAAVKVMVNKGNGDMLVMIPKPKEGFEIDDQALARAIRPILDELAKPFDRENPGLSAERFHIRPHGRP
jgi:hypothetical protein